MENKLIYSKISEVMNATGAIAKGKKNVQQGYSFRGIDDMYNALNVHLAAAKIFFTSNIISKERMERETKAGGTLFYTVLQIEWSIFAEDGSFVVTETVGEAMDSGDKSSNKAMSAAYKYALMQVFCIPTEEPKDTELETHDVKPIATKTPVTPPPTFLDPKKKEPMTPASSVVVAPITANGNPKGTITEDQTKKLYAVLNEMGADAEKANDYAVEKFGCRLSGLSKEQAIVLIDALERKIAMTKKTAETVTMTTDEVVAALGGEESGSALMREAMEKGRMAQRAKMGNL